MLNHVSHPQKMLVISPPFRNPVHPVHPNVHPANGRLEQMDHGMLPIPGE